MKTIFAHDDDCPLGTNGLRAYHEACAALSSLPPEARNTDKDHADIAQAWFELEEHHKCNCGCDQANAAWHGYWTEVANHKEPAAEPPRSWSIAPRSKQSP